jgi:hypothetical protein
VDIMTRRLFLIASLVLFTAATAQAARFTVDDVGSSTNYLRIMSKKGTTSLTTTLREEIAVGTVPAYASTGKAAKDTNKVSATLASGLNFTGTGGTGAVTLGFGKVGKITGTFDIGSAAKALSLKGAKGTANVAANMTYYVNALEQRKLKVTNSTLKLGGVLKGANINAAYNVITGNKVAGSATYVTIAKNGILTTGGLTVNETAVMDDAAKSVALTGRLNTYDPKLAVKGILVGVTSAEAAGVGDPGGYKDLKVAYSANVGIASKIQKKPGGMLDFGDAAKTSVLKATVGAGEQMGAYHYVAGKFVSDYSLSSKVAKNATTGLGLAAEVLAPDSVTLASINSKGKFVKSNLKNVYGIVGSEAEIVASTARVDGGELSMAWRARTQAEAHYKEGPVLPTTPGLGPKWLTSDVVKIAGTTANDVFALQMTFDNRINLALDGQTDGQLDKEWTGMYIGKLNDAGTAWTKGGLAAVGNYESLTAFMEANSGKTLEQLEGSWGVDKAASKSWAIVRGGGSGVFAVVPEPATIVMMLSAALGAMTYGWRRWSRKSSETVA